MTVSDELISKIRTLGTLGYTVEKVKAIMAENPEIATDLEDVDSPIFKAFRAGLEQRQVEYDIKKYTLLKDEVLLSEMEFARKKSYYDLRKELFDI